MMTMIRSVLVFVMLSLWPGELSRVRVISSRRRSPCRRRSASSIARTGGTGCGHQHNYHIIRERINPITQG